MSHTFVKIQVGFLRLKLLEITNIAILFLTFRDLDPILITFVNETKNLNEDLLMATLTSSKFCLQLVREK